MIFEHYLHMVLQWAGAKDAKVLQSITRLSLSSIRQPLLSKAAMLLRQVFDTSLSKLHLHVRAGKSTASLPPS